MYKKLGLFLVLLTLNVSAGITFNDLPKEVKINCICESSNIREFESFFEAVFKVDELDISTFKYILKKYMMKNNIQGYGDLLKIVCNSDSYNLFNLLNKANLIDFKSEITVDAFLEGLNGGSTNITKFFIESGYLFKNGQFIDKVELIDFKGLETLITAINRSKDPRYTDFLLIFVSIDALAYNMKRYIDDTGNANGSMAFILSLSYDNQLEVINRVKELYNAEREKEELSYYNIKKININNYIIRK